VYNGINKWAIDREAGLLTEKQERELLAERTQFIIFRDKRWEHDGELSKALAQKYGWRHDECGWDSTPNETAPFNKPLTDLGNRDRRIETLTAWKARRPRDPFATFEHSQTLGGKLLLLQASHDNAAQLVTLAKITYKAALEDVPDGTSFSNYRLALLVQAGHLANNGAGRANNSRSGSAFGGKAEISVATAAWEKCLALSNDDDGFYRMRLAIAIGLGGDLSAAHSQLTKIAPLRRQRKCIIFATNYAAISSKVKKTETAIEWMKLAREWGADLTGFSNDPDLDFARHRHSDEFRVLTGRLATIRVLVPDANAVIFVDGKKTSQIGLERHFHTPPLEAKTQGSYSYRIRVEFRQFGVGVRKVGGKFFSLSRIRFDASPLQAKTCENSELFSVHLLF
jgi:uncharacterized protein (TIGR03000 family)